MSGFQLGSAVGHCIAKLTGTSQTWANSVWSRAGSIAEGGALTWAATTVGFSGGWATWALCQYTAVWVDVGASVVVSARGGPYTYSTGWPGALDVNECIPEP